MSSAESSTTMTTTAAGTKFERQRAGWQRGRRCQPASSFAVAQLRRRMATSVASAAPSAATQPRERRKRTSVALASISVAVISVLILIVSIGQVVVVVVAEAQQQTLDENSFGLPLALAASMASGGSGGGEKPRLIPLVAADSGYSENSSVNILCTVSQGHHETLTFDWFKDGQLLLNQQHKSGHHVGQPQQQQQHDNGNKIERDDDELTSLNAGQFAPQIEMNPDHSLLRISRVRSQHSGRYTCAAKNQFGQDSSSVNLLVNVKLQWTKEPPKEIVVSANQELKADCLAQGEPKPQMRWEKLDSSASLLPGSGSGRQRADQVAAAGSLQAKNQLVADSNGYKLAQQHHHHHHQQPPATGSQNSLLVSSNRYLTIQRARESDAGIYECIASNSHDADLRKLVHVQVRGPPKILPIATADSYPEGSSINLICTVSGGQRRGLTLSWMLNGQELLNGQAAKYDTANSLSEPDNVSINTDEADISILRIKNATNNNSGQYTCTAKNPLGQDSTSVKIVINVELKWNKVPKDVEVGLNQELAVECDAIGSPQPTIEWTKHNSANERNSNSNGTVLVSKGKLLKLAKAQHKDSGLYECRARNGVDEDLRQIIQVKVRGPPKILPIATADSYPEGSTINLICTVSGGQRKGLTLGWLKDGEELNDELLRYSTTIGDNVSIEKTGVDISILRISNATHTNSGRFSCTAKNPLGEDSTSVNIVINVELKWKNVPEDTEIGLNQDLSIECDAIGQPQPQITWTKHPSSMSTNRSSNDTNKPIVVSQGKVLKLTKAQHKDSGLYECVARNGVDQDLRRIIQVRVRGKFPSTQYG